MDILCQASSVQALNKKTDNLHVHSSFQQDIRNCNVPCFTETWLNPGIPEIAFQPGEGHCVPGHEHQPAVFGGLGNEAVLLRLPLHAGAAEGGIR